MAHETFPWRAVMGLGLGRLGLAPSQFWAATLRELLAAAEGLGTARAAPMERDALSRLMTQFPDERAST